MTKIVDAIANHWFHRREHDDWENYKPKFRKVMPVEYRRALAELMTQTEQRPVAAAGE